MGPGKAVTDGLIFSVDGGNTKSYPGSGTNLTNIGLTTSTASLINGVAYTSSQGGAFFFDGSNDYISCGDTNFQISGGSLSFEVVFYYDGLDKTNMPIFTKRNPNSPFNQWGLVISNGNLYTGGTGKVLSTFLRPDESSNTGPPDPKDRGTTYTLPSAGIYHVVVTNSSVSASLYVNGILQSTVTSSQSQNNFLVSGADMRIGNNNAASYFTGSIYTTRLYNRTLTDAEVFQNYEATRERFNRPTIVTDDDARNFLNSANISSETQQRAVNDLVVDLKNAGLWGKMKAIYPFVGGTAASHKWNLKDPRDVDAAFRLTFSGGWTHSSTGADPNGTNAYADTYFIANSNLSLYDGHLSYYARENITVTGTTQALIGVGSNGASWNGKEAWYIEFASTNANYSHHSTSPTTDRGYVTPTISIQGYSIGTRRTSDPTTLKFFKNNTLLSTASTSVAGQALNIYSVYIGAFNNRTTSAPYASNFTSNECSFATIGNGLTDTDAANLYTIVQKYQTTLGRQV